MSIADKVHGLCTDCAHSIHGGTITPAYADAVTRLLFMTIAHESDAFRARRQYGFSARSTRGAFGFAQTERGSMEASLARIRRKDAVGAACRAYLARYGTPVPATFTDAAMTVQYPTGDALSVLLCRLHYLRVPSPCPADIDEQAKYAKKHYNTVLGKATPAQYKAAFLRHWPGQ